MAERLTDNDTTIRPRTPTARGDREQRHKDVLDAAGAVLDELGWDQFSIRDVATRAGVSAGAVYQWFSGKGEIWARLQTSRFERDARAIADWPDDLEPAEVVRRAVEVIAVNHAEIGRYRFDFVIGLKGAVPDYANDLTRAHMAVGERLAARVMPLLPDSLDETARRARQSWLWAVGKGIGDHLVDDRFAVQGIDREAFLATSTTMVLSGLTAD
ncbi:MAG: TetR/AcrR family transcriptional regulator [Actinomycetota bacterium]